ncbi:MAG: hypothetical protein WD397_11765 [Wenzhouxiangellaceae bacterium]
MARRRHDALDISNNAASISRKLFSELLAALQRHRAWAGLRARKPIKDAPGRSQWGRIKEAANRHRFDHAALWHEVYGNGPRDESTNGIVSLRSGWGLELGPDETLADLFYQQMEEYRDSKILADTLGRLAALGLTARWSEAVSGEQRESATEEGAA